MSKRNLMGYTLESGHFRYQRDLFALLPADADRDDDACIDVDVDATYSPYEGAEDLCVTTDDGRVVTEMLTQEAFDDLRKRWERWFYHRERERAEAARDSDADCRMDEMRERRKERV